jgi:hypothetical protein
MRNVTKNVIGISPSTSMVPPAAGYVKKVPAGGKSMNIPEPLSLDCKPPAKIKGVSKADGVTESFAATRVGVAPPKDTPSTAVGTRTSSGNVCGSSSAVAVATTTNAATSVAAAAATAAIHHPQCTVCLSRNANIILIPCGHVCLCQDDADKLKANQQLLTCPICREAVSSTNKVFLNFS